MIIVYHLSQSVACSQKDGHLAIFPPLPDIGHDDKVLQKIQSLDITSVYREDRNIWGDELSFDKWQARGREVIEHRKAWSISLRRAVAYILGRPRSW